MACAGASGEAAAAGSAGRGGDGFARGEGFRESGIAVNVRVGSGALLYYALGGGPTRGVISWRRACVS